MDKNATELFERAQQSLRADHERVQELIRERDGTVEGNFIQKLLAWMTNEEQAQNAWSMFHEAFYFDKLNLLGSLDSFVSNYLLDDSYFKIEWRKPDYVYRDVTFADVTFADKTLHTPELQWLPSGDIKTVLTTKEDPQGTPVVVRANDDGGSQDASLLIEAMDICEQRRLDRLAQFEEFEKAWDTP